MVNLWFFANFGDHEGLYTTRFLNRSNLALPYICHLIVFSLLKFHSAGPLLQGRLIAFPTALKSPVALLRKTPSPILLTCLSTTYTLFKRYSSFLLILKLLKIIPWQFTSCSFSTTKPFFLKNGIAVILTFAQSANCD